MPTVAPAAVETVAGLVAVPLATPALVADISGVAVPDAVFDGIRLLLATAGMLTF